jgi:hypothetical protein
MQSTDRSSSTLLLHGPSEFVVAAKHLVRLHRRRLGGAVCLLDALPPPAAVAQAKSVPHPEPGATLRSNLLPVSSLTHPPIVLRAADSGVEQVTTLGASSAVYGARAFPDHSRHRPVQSAGAAHQLRRYGSSRLVRTGEKNRYHPPPLQPPLTSAFQRRVLATQLVCVAVRVEPMMDMGQLAEYLVPRGYTIPIMPELKMVLPAASLHLLLCAATARQRHASLVDRFALW